MVCVFFCDKLAVAQSFIFKEGVPACSEFCLYIVIEKTGYLIIMKP